jgi:hypothetical protein
MGKTLFDFLPTRVGRATKFCFFLPPGIIGPMHQHNAPPKIPAWPRNFTILGNVLPNTKSGGEEWERIWQQPFP